MLPELLLELKDDELKQAVEHHLGQIPQGMQRAMARQAEAERERRAKVINAYEAAIRLADALGATEVAGLLRANLDQEVSALQTLGKQADRLATLEGTV